MVVSIVLTSRETLPMKKRIALLPTLLLPILFATSLSSTLPAKADQNCPVNPNSQLHRVKIAALLSGTPTQLLPSTPANNATASPTVKPIAISQPSRKTSKRATGVSLRKKVNKLGDKRVLRKTKKGKKSSKKARAVTPAIEAEDEVKYVALTFDDGPNPTYTPKILALLKKEGVHATFFVIGRQAKKYPELVEQIVADGHKVADHTMNHDEQLYKRSDARIEQEVLGTKTLIESIVPGTTVEYYRAPAGNMNRHERRLVAEWGMKSINWSVDTKDWQRPGVATILKTVKRQLRNGGIILMHDAGGDRTQTIAALKKLIPKLKKDGYEFVFPSTALAARKAPVVAANDDGQD